MSTNNSAPQKILNLKTSLNILACSFLLTACGGSGNNDEHNQEHAINTTETSLTLVQDGQSQSIQSINRSAVSIKDNQQQAPYLYKQVYTRAHEKFQKNYDFTYTFSANSTEYTVRAIYNQPNHEPDYVTIKQKNTQKENFFSCFKDERVCQGISLQLDEKTGQTTLKFSNATLKNDQNSILINGEILGKLAQAPTAVNIPTSLQHQLIASSKNTFADPFNIEQTHYQNMIFTNHNQIYLSTGFETRTPIEVHIVDHQVKKVTYYMNSFLKGINWAFDASINANNPPTYDTKNYIVSFNDTHLYTTDPMNTPYPDTFLKGSIGP